ncbi:MAG: hypothetical protein IJR00_09315 [Lachnospiraceae bacterium]|nr:hypothetical protein [Lachnospiraceae bacterium]
MKQKTTRTLRNLRKRTVALLALLCALLAVTLSGCGGGSKGKEYVGYYTYLWDDFKWSDQYSHNYIGLQIFPDGTAVYMSELNGSHRGTLEIEDGEAHIYLTKAYDRGGESASSYAQYCPLTLKLTDGGKSALLSSAHPDWMTDSFDVVDEQTFVEFINKASYNKIVSYDGKNWVTYEERTQ